MNVKLTSVVIITIKVTCNCSNNYSSKHNRQTSICVIITIKVICNCRTSESCDLAISTRILAAGWTMSRSFMMVAPSLEMVVLPLSSWINLSIPLGPRVVLTASPTTVHAVMLLSNCAFPWDVSVPSFSKMICGCCLRTVYKRYQYHH